MNDFRVEKIERAAVLFFADGVVLEGVMYLSPFAQGHSGGQTVLELLEEKDRYLPLHDQKGAFRLVNKQALTHLRYEEEGGNDAMEELGERIRVRIIFFGGETLEGAIVLNMPENKRRLADFLNAFPDFFPLDGGSVRYIVNGQMIREITPVR